MKPTVETQQGACSLPYDPTPSKEDIEVTKRLISAGQIIGIDLLDHVIIGDGQYFSLKEKGLI